MMHLYKVELDNWKCHYDLLLQTASKKQQVVRDTIVRDMPQDEDDLNAVVKKRHLKKLLLKNIDEINKSKSKQLKVLDNKLQAILHNCASDLKTVLFLKPWITTESRERILNGKVIGIIDCLIGNYHETYAKLQDKGYLRDICEIIDIAFAIDPKHIKRHSEIMAFREKDGSQVQRLKKSALSRPCRVSELGYQS